MFFFFILFFFFFILYFFFFFFFFSSRRRHTRSYGDWSSHVCSSDLDSDAAALKQYVSSGGHLLCIGNLGASKSVRDDYIKRPKQLLTDWTRNERSEERRVGKECRSGREREKEKKKAVRTVRERIRCQ